MATTSTKQSSEPRETKPEEKPAPRRVHNKEFFAGVVARVHLPEDMVAAVYQAMLEEMLEIFGRGEYLVLRGLGRFYPQIHRGHQVQFVKGKSSINDYAVLKFSASPDVNKSLGEDLDRLGIEEL